MSFDLKSPCDSKFKEKSAAQNTLSIFQLIFRPKLFSSQTHCSSPFNSSHSIRPCRSYQPIIMAQLGLASQRLRTSNISIFSAQKCIIFRIHFLYISVSRMTRQSCRRRPCAAS
jgi:hypothetical protein